MPRCSSCSWVAIKKKKKKKKKTTEESAFIEIHTKTCKSAQAPTGVYLCTPMHTHEREEVPLQKKKY
ncbi:hypothetical protein POVWA1_018220 [Plasmodium ovale wallikeri]|uniref:Uncharacterized protein n=1 Tax=Plasmodium ovale wallikeri TaxID=864142 RepID=A0A1A8YPV6_PLAOA|nr:hypothetical protein POVWA1_018220 [Plasmodium ovale wallikeri]